MYAPKFFLVCSFGIVPSNKTTYTLARLQGAIKSQTGAVPYFGCQKNGTILSEVWYFSHVFGTVCFFILPFTVSYILYRNNMGHTRQSIRPPSRHALPQAPLCIWKERPRLSMKLEAIIDVLSILVSNKYIFNS